jgi:hypothetical protein
VRYLFDTDHISILQRRSAPEHAILVARVASHPAADLAFSIVSFHEQVSGAHSFISQSRTAAQTIRGYELLTEVLHGFSGVLVLPFVIAFGARKAPDEGDEELDDLTGGDHGGQGFARPSVVMR